MLKNTFKNKEKIRTYMRNKRKLIGSIEKNNEAKKIAKLSYHCSFIFNAKNIAIFLSFDGEIDTYPLIKKLWLHQKNVFIPVIDSFQNKKLLFVRFHCNSALSYNKYKILEPSFTKKDLILLSNLDVVIVPLVAFDKTGVRLGMGGGFYDNFLQNWPQKKIFPVGFSYSFQLFSKIPKNIWDISLPMVLTPNKLWVFK